MSDPISAFMRDFLIEHLDQKPVPVIQTTVRGLSASEMVDHSHRARSRASAIRKRWLRITRDDKHTIITEEGRAALAEALGDWADAVARAQETEEARRWLAPVLDQPVPAKPLTDSTKLIF